MEKAHWTWSYATAWDFRSFMPRRGVSLWAGVTDPRHQYHLGSWQWTGTGTLLCPVNGWELPGPTLVETQWWIQMAMGQLCFHSKRSEFCDPGRYSPLAEGSSERQLKDGWAIIGLHCLYLDDILRQNLDNKSQHLLPSVLWDLWVNFILKSDTIVL